MLRKKLESIKIIYRLKLPDNRIVAVINRGKSGLQKDTVPVNDWQR